MEDVRRELNEVREEIQGLHSAIDDLSALVRQNPEQRPAEEVPAQQEERQVIAENAHFMEAIQDAGDSDSNESTDDDSDASSEDDSSDSSDDSDDIAIEEQQAQAENPRDVEQPRAEQQHEHAENPPWHRGTKGCPEIRTRDGPSPCEC
ncbi:hypothetical protein COOONC_06330 [Cooperia oncophora]